GPDVVDVDRQFLAGRGKEAGEEHVRAPRELKDDLTAFGHRDVDADGTFVAVERLPHGSETVGAGRHTRRGQAPDRVASVRVLDLDDLRAPLAQHCAGGWHHAVLRDFQNSDSLEDLRHSLSPFPDDPRRADAAMRRWLQIKSKPATFPREAPSARTGPARGP